MQSPFSTSDVTYNFRTPVGSQEIVFAVDFDRVVLGRHTAETPTDGRRTKLLSEVLSTVNGDVFHVVAAHCDGDMYVCKSSV